MACLNVSRGDGNPPPVVIATMAHKPSSSPTPKIGGRTLSHRPRQSKGARNAAAGSLATVFACTTATSLTTGLGSRAGSAGAGGVLSRGEWKTALTMVFAPGRLLWWLEAAR